MPARELGRLAAEGAAAAAREDVEHLVVGLVSVLLRGAVEAQNALLELVAAPGGAEEGSSPGWVAHRISNQGTCVNTPKGVTIDRLISRFSQQTWLRGVLLSETHKEGTGC